MQQILSTTLGMTISLPPFANDSKASFPWVDRRDLTMLKAAESSRRMITDESLADLVA